MTETDHGKPYTDADVETVARALWAQCGEPERTRPTPTCHEDARAVLDALTAAGWRKHDTAGAQSPISPAEARELLALIERRASDSPSPEPAGNYPDDPPHCTLRPGQLSTCYCTYRADCPIREADDEEEG